MTPPIIGQLFLHASIYVLCKYQAIIVCVCFSDAVSGIVHPKHIIERAGKIAKYNSLRIIPPGQVPSLNNGILCKGELTIINFDVILLLWLCFSLLLIMI